MARSLRVVLVSHLFLLLGVDECALNPLNGGTALPFRSTGNKRAEVLRGRDMLILSLNRFAWPKSTAAEAAATVARFSHNPRIYSNSQITEAEDRLGLTRKVGSTEAEQAYTPANILRADLFFTTSFPTGVFGLPRNSLIDTDECALTLQAMNRSYGKSGFNVRVREDHMENYEKRY